MKKNYIIIILMVLFLPVCISAETNIVLKGANIDCELRYESTSGALCKDSNGTVMAIASKMYERSDDVFHPSRVTGIRLYNKDIDIKGQPETYLDSTQLIYYASQHQHVGVTAMGNAFACTGSGGVNAIYLYPPGSSFDVNIYDRNTDTWSVKKGMSPREFYELAVICDKDKIVDYGPLYYAEDPGVNCDEVANTTIYPEYVAWLESTRSHQCWEFEDRSGIGGIIGIKRFVPVASENMYTAECESDAQRAQEIIQDIDDLLENNGSTCSPQMKEALETIREILQDFYQLWKSATGAGQDYGFTPNDKYCPLGADVTADLSGALKIMKILAPILVFVFSAYEAVNSIRSADPEQEIKTVFQKFVKRMIAAVVLFVIPVLVDVLMQTMNVWDESGHCVIDSDGNITTNDQTTNNNQTSSACHNECFSQYGTYKPAYNDCMRKCACKKRCEENVKDQKGVEMCKEKC